MANYDTKKLTTTAMMAAVVFVTTMVVKIPIGQGYLNFGDAAVFLAGLLLSPGYAFAAAAVGSSLADMIGYPIYIPATFLLKGIMALIASKAKNKDKKGKVITMITGGLIMVIGYYLYEAFILYGNVISPLYYIPFNILQFSVGIIIALILINPLKNKLE
ncbi:MAG: ECF transporter S component [Bacillota bacterium]|nr:ECF transporter S component [Bacillota bacterium]